MLRKMEKGVAEETSLLEFIKSKGLALKGEGDRGCWVMLGGWRPPCQCFQAESACWRPLSLSTTLRGDARASSGTSRAVARPSLGTTGRWTQPLSCYKTVMLRSVEPESSLKMGLRILNGMSTLENASWVV